MEEKQKHILTDKFNRFHNYLRISLTDRCNFRCNYCMPENVMFMSQRHLLSAAEINKITGLFVNYGISKIRLTGGEPLVRKDFPEILQLLSNYHIELALTTNGYLLDQYTGDLVKANISSVNISLDTLNHHKFSHITHRNYFKRTIENIRSTINAGLPVKLNAVITRNFNDDEILNFAELTLSEKIDIRFIEFMPFRGNKWDQGKLVSKHEILARIKHKHHVERLPVRKNQTAQQYQIQGAKGRFGIISTVSEPFCDGCNRLRLTADGKIKNCLFGTNEYDIKTPFRKNLDISGIIKKAVLDKFKSHGGVDQFSNMHIAEYQKNRSMVSIGG